MKRDQAQKLQEMALAIVKQAINREKAIEEVVAKRGLSYAALRQLKAAE